jgi:CysZ protein
MISAFAQGVQHFIKGFTLIKHPKLRNYARIPLIINTLLFILVSWFSVVWLDLFMERIFPDWLAFLEYLIWPLFALSYFLFVFYTFSLLANLIAAPFTGLLAERTESILLGASSTTETSLSGFAAGVLPAFAHELSKLMYFALRAIPLLVLFFIPGPNVLAPFLWLVFSAWMLSVEYLDIPLSNHTPSFRQTRETVRQHRSLCMGFGTAASLATMIPVINFIAVPTAVCGATALWVAIRESTEGSSPGTS